jgi:hypothetical protein
MAQQFIKALLHKPGWNDFYTGMSQVGNTRIAMSATSGYPVTAGVSILGAGQPAIYGLALNACFIATSAGSASGGGPSPTSIDPPIVYTFCNATQPYGRDFLNLNLKMIRANDYSFNIQVILSGNPVNCTGGFLRMSAKWQPTDTDGNEIFAVESPSSGITWINQSQGTANILIARDLTNIPAVPYHRIDVPYDVQLTNAAGQVQTVMYGTLTILPNISQTSP